MRLAFGLIALSLAACGSTPSASKAHDAAVAPHATVRPAAPALSSQELQQTATELAQMSLEELSRDDRAWPMVARNYANTRESGMRDVNRDNVQGLKLAWTFETSNRSGHEAAPLVIGETMYFTTPFPNRVFALDLKANGKLKWFHEGQAEAAAQGVACCDVVNRGAAYSGGRVFYNTLDGQTIALDAQTGQQLWRTKLADINRGETMTMAPLVVGDRVYVGNSGGELGVRGWLAALDTDTGDIAYRAYSTGPDRDVLIGSTFKPYYASERGTDLGTSTWPGDKWSIGGGTVWGFLSYDPQLDLLYYGTGNPGPWNPDQRPGDNKWTCGVFARKSSGEAIWFYQWNPHDIADHDGINENVLVDLDVSGDGNAQKVLLHADRNGFLYVLDRTSGRVLSATPFVRTTITPEVDLKSGRPIINPDKVTGTGKTATDICPAAPGGKDWPPSAFSHQTGLLYIPANNLCEDEQGYEANYIAGTPYLGTHTRMYAGPGGHRGELIGWDVRAKRAAFRVPERFPVWSGALVTDGGVVFYGTQDGYFKALDAKTGKLLWEYKLTSGVAGQPITYRGPDGKQYIAILSGPGGWAGVTVSGEVDTRDTSGALGMLGATGDLRRATTRGGRLYSFALP